MQHALPRLLSLSVACTNQRHVPAKGLAEVRRGPAAGGAPAVEAAAVARLCHLLQRLWLHLAQILRRWRASGPRRFAQMTERTAVPPLGGRARAFARARVR